MKSITFLLVFIPLFISAKKDNQSPPPIDLKKNIITTDPFSVAPLTAIVQLTDSAARPENVDEIFVKVLGKADKFGDPGIDISTTLYPHTDKFKLHFFDITRDKMFEGKVITSQDKIEIPILGLYPDYENKVYIAVKTGKTTSSDTLSIQTGPLPDTSLSIQITTCKPKLMEKGDATWMTADNYPYDFMFDIKGEIRWVIDVEGNSDLRALDNGNLLIRSWWAEGNFGEYTMLGESVNRWILPDEFRNHHDIVEMPGGNFLVPVTHNKNEPDSILSLQDVIIEIDRNSGAIVNNWDLFELMDIINLPEVWKADNTWYRDHFLKEGPGDWFHMNSISYDTKRDEIIVSGKHGGIVKLTRNGENGSETNANKSIVWYMPRYGQYSVYANHPATKDFILTAINSSGKPFANQADNHDDFHWCKYQHHPVITRSKRKSVQFLIFNNVYDKNTSAIVEYLVDEKRNTVQEVWQFGGNEKQYFAAAWAGTALFPETGNRLMVTAFPTNPKVEVTEDKEIVFGYKLNSVDHKPSWYRGGRMNLYPDASK